MLGGTVAATVAGATALPAYGADVQITDSARTVSLLNRAPRIFIGLALPLQTTGGTP